MNGMGMLTQLPSNPQPLSKSTNTLPQSDGESTFAQLLGQFVTNVDGNPSYFITEEEENTGIKDLLIHLLDGIDLNEAELELEANHEIKNLLNLLPIELQEEITAFMQSNEHDLQTLLLWPQLQQVVLILVNEIASQRTKLDPLLYELASTFNGLDVVDTDSIDELIMKFKQFIDQKKADGQAVLDIQLFEEVEKVPVNVKLSFPNELLHKQGLNVSQTGQELGQAISRAEQSTIHIGDRLPKEMQQQQFLRQFQSLIQRSVMTQSATGLNTLSIKLFPAHLGRLDIQLTQVDGVITAKILTGSGTAKELIESQINQLRQAFNQQQIQVERIEVSQQYLEKEKEQSSNRNSQEDESLHDETEHEGDSDFQELLEEATFNKQV